LVKVSNINQIISQFEKTVKDCIKQSYSNWIKNHYSKLWHLQSILDELKVYLPTNGQSHNLPEELWDEVKKKFLQIIAWTENIIYTSDDLSLKSLSHTWKKGFNEVQFSLPEKIKLEISSSLLQVQSGDRNGLKYRKKIFNVLKNLPFNLYGSKTNLRKIELHNFLINFLEVPVTNAIFNIWQHFLNEISEQYLDMFNKITELKEKSLFLDDLEKLQDPFEKIDYFEKIFTIAEVLNQTDILLQSLHERENQITHLIEKEWKQIAEDIEYYWQYAGTFLLPNKKYREELLSYNKKVAEKNFRKYVNYWKEKFYSIKTNWIKNIEIFILQLHIIEEFRISSKNIIINNEVILNPAFEDIIYSIEKEEKKYLSTFTSGAFKQKVHKSKNNFIDKFKNHKIPQLVDAIYQTQTPEALENFINNIDDAYQKISAIHNIVKFQQNGSLPPKSKIYPIALPELINNEIILPYSKHFKKQISEVKNRIRGIIRSLTEINHLYEINWDSASTLVKNGNNNGEIEKARSAIKTSLKRSKEIINKLWQESKETLLYSKELLVTNSKDLYTGYQGLTNTDQLIDYNIKLKREKNQIHFQNLLKKLYGFITYTLYESIKNFIIKTASFLHLKDYQSKRNIEEILMDYSKTAYLRLSKIPAVYHRLYMAEPASENRFYYERKKETNNIENAFQKWQKKDNVLTVLIGEKGAGKTSILNFSENNIFKDYNVIRINIESKCLREDELLVILKNSFQCKNVNSWEQLEDNIKKKTTSQVVILDNLHNLFLKIPNGFNAIERFTLFLQHTQHAVFWILSSSLYSWILLDRILNVSKYINFPIHIECLSTEQLKSIILKRHKISGYEIIFEAEEAEVKLKRYKKLQSSEKQQIFLEDRFFNMLHKITNGNIAIAFQYWLTSIKEFKDDNVFITPISYIESKIFEQFNLNDLINLVPFIQHDRLNTNEYGIIMRILKHQNLLVLNRLASFGFIENKNNTFDLNILHYATIKNILLSNKYIYENNINNEPKSDELITIELYLPVKTDILLTRKIALQSTAVSKYIDLGKDISVNITNKTFNGVSLINLKIHANIVDPLNKNAFVSEVTEMIFRELLNQNIISQEDFYN
jgi:hypothetical protein